MNEYTIRITTATTIYVTAENEEEAVEVAYEQSMREVPDSWDADIIECEEIE